jgi:hypothetical protein
VAGRPRAGRGGLEHLPADDHGLPRRRPHRGLRTMTSLIEALSTSVPEELTELVRSSAEPPTFWPTSRDPAPATGRPRRSTAASTTSAEAPSGSATSPTPSPDPCSRPAGLDRGYTLDCEEPVILQHRSHTGRPFIRMGPRFDQVSNWISAGPTKEATNESRQLLSVSEEKPSMRSLMRQVW